MKKLIAILTIICLVSCGPQPQNKYLTYQNIGILSDMSSRIVNKPPKDVDKIFDIVHFFKDECVKPGEKIGDRSCIFFSAFSGNAIASIDISQIKNLGEKQQFINSTGKYQHRGLDYQIDDFKLKVKNAYSNTRDKGLDLISVLMEKIENTGIVKRDTFFTNDGIDTTFVKYENHIYIFTDGYLEYFNKSVNDQFYFGVPEIEKVRKICISKKLDVKDALGVDTSLCLPPHKCVLNQYITLHVLETQERDKNDEFNIYTHPTGQRDNEILEAVWRKWALQSGFKGFEWKKY